MANKLNPGEVLAFGESLESNNGCHQLVVQENGNIVLYSLGIPIWSLNTKGSERPFLAMQTDGNLVAYDVNDKPLFDTRTSGNGRSDLVLQDDRNLVLYRRKRTRTIKIPKMQGVGGVKTRVPIPRTAIWSTNTVMPAEMFDPVEFEAPDTLLPRIQATANPAMVPFFSIGVEGAKWGVRCAVTGPGAVACGTVLIVILVLIEFNTGDPPFGPNNDIRIIGGEISEGMRAIGGQLNKAFDAAGGDLSDAWKDAGGNISDTTKEWGAKASDYWKKVF